MLKFRSQAVSPRRQHCSSSRQPRSRLHLEPLEDRLALSWTGVPPSTIVPPTNAVAVTANGQGNASITQNENDFYTFVAPSSGSYRLSALTPSSNLDTVLGLFDANGRRIAYNDDISFTNRDSQLSAKLTGGSRYYFGITNYTRTAGGSYTWQTSGPASVPADDSFEDNDSLAQATDLGTPTAPRTVTNLVMADAADWFRFTTTATGTSSNSATITFQQSQGDLDLELYNTGGQRLRLSNGTGNSETVSLNSLAAGTYFVRVYGYRGATNPAYTLAITPPTAATPTPPPAGSFDIVLRVTGMTASQQQIFERAASRWEQIITGDASSAIYQGVAVDDLLIDARARAIDGAGNTLGEAGPDAFRSGSRLPIHGTMDFDSADLASLESKGQLYDVILHEMGHVLGIGTIWQSLGLLSGAGTTNPRFLGARATAEYNTIFGATGTSVPVEGLPSGPGSRDGHWRESVFGNELMSPYISGTPNPLSRVTVAALADMGYTVNLSAADVYSPPRLSTGGGSGGGGGGGPSLVAQTPASAWPYVLQTLATGLRTTGIVPALRGDTGALLSPSRVQNGTGSQRATEALSAGRDGQDSGVETHACLGLGEAVGTLADLFTSRLTLDILNGDEALWRL